MQHFFYSRKKKTVLSILCPSPPFFSCLRLHFLLRLEFITFASRRRKAILHSSVATVSRHVCQHQHPTPFFFNFFLLPVSLAPHILNEFLSCLTLLGLCRMKRCLLCILWLKCVYSRGINAVTDRAE